MSGERRLVPPDLAPPDGTVAAGHSGRPPRPGDELESEAIERARADRVEAGARRDPDLARAGGGPGDDLGGGAEEDGAPALSLLHHLDELRTRILRSVLAILLGAAVGWWFSAAALEWAIRHTVGSVVVLDPLESFTERFKLALVLGACVALPLVLYQAWAFVLPGLFRRERRLLLPLVAASLVLFFAGAATAILLVVPAVLEALRIFLTPSMQQQIRLSSLLGFLYNLALATGVVFQLPLVAGALAALRLLTSRWLIRRWRVAIVTMLIVSALITPGDVVTAQIVLGVPLVVLYLLSIGVAWTIERIRRNDDIPGEEAR
jgi:sec-independent protein translocase protein TatC